MDHGIGDGWIGAMKMQQCCRQRTGGLFFPKQRVTTKFVVYCYCFAGHEILVAVAFVVAAAAAAAAAPVAGGIVERQVVLLVLTSFHVCG